MWTLHRTPRNTLHVVNSEDGSHFEASSEDEARENIAAIAEAQEAAQRAAEEAAQTTNEVQAPAEGTVGTLRIN